MLDLTVFGDLPWMHDALCAKRGYDRDAWFPSHGQRTTQAKAVCEQCAVQHECLTYALSEDIRDGVWGGTTPRERRELAQSGRLDVGPIARNDSHLGRRSPREITRSGDAVRGSSHARSK